MNGTNRQGGRTVAYRALCLGALLKRAEFEIALQELDAPDTPDRTRRRITARHHDLNEQLQQWIHAERLRPYLTETEQTLFDKPLSTWSERMIIQTGWRVESLGVMMWALEVLPDIPAYDTLFDPEEVLCPLEIMTPAIDFIWRAELRPHPVLDQVRNQAELWNWRSRAAELQRMGVRPPEGTSFAEIIRMTAEKAYREGYIPPLIDGDFPVFGKAYAHQTADEHAITGAIAYERYATLNWLCELAADREDIPADR